MRDGDNAPEQACIPNASARQKHRGPGPQAAEHQADGAVGAGCGAENGARVRRSSWRAAAGYEETPGTGLAGRRTGDLPRAVVV